MDWVAIGLTARLAACAALVLLVIGVPVAYWLTTTHWRGRMFVEAVVALPLVLPPTVLGFYLLVAFGPRYPFGRWYETLTGHLLPFSFSGLLIASVIYSLPFAVQPFLVAFRSLDPTFADVAKTFGATRLQIFRHVAVPLAWHGIVAGAVLSFAHTLGEFGVVLMVGGNIPGVTRTLSISIYDQVQSLDYAAAAANSLFLLVACFAILSITYLLQRHFRIA
ncbi:MAG TPA: molybdate ABC transporter permease subunit [Verrucomicrobiae bacterium]|nr:molybdate ABC transporter permease subunit [Verrucomicrobiae bacterium]